MSGLEIARLVGELGWSNAGLAALAAAFGPSVVLFGQTLRGMGKPFSERLISIAERAAEKKHDDADDDGQVSPRVLQRVLTDGIFTDDPVAHDYFAGLVAGSWSKDGQDDSAIPLVQMLTRLSTAEMRLHYLIYRSLNLGLRGGWSLGVSQGRKQAAIYLPGSVLGLVLGTVPVSSLVVGLVRESLIDEEWAVGPADRLSQAARVTSWSAPEAGIIVWPSFSGLELAIRAEANDTVPGQFLYMTEWRAAEIRFPPRAAEFPNAPTTPQQLASIRESWGSYEPVAELGWALPQPDDADDPEEDSSDHERTAEESSAAG